MRIDNEVSDVLANSRIDGGLLFLPPAQLERNLYVKVNKVLEAIGGKWNRGKKAHVFDNPPENIVEEILQTGQYTDAKKEYQFFETPPELVARMIELAEYGETEEKGTDFTTLEPSAGMGAIASKIPFEFGSTFVELDPFKADFLKKKFPPFHVDCADFMTWEPGEHTPKKFDRVIMNPPFSRQQDIDHVTRALGFLADGGKLIAIMSASVLFRTNRKTVEFRELIESLGGTIEALPAETFKSSGTMVNTCLVVVG
jgi:predicted RNA methylase